jgi:hypothetical protein
MDTRLMAGPFRLSHPLHLFHLLCLVPPRPAPRFARILLSSGLSNTARLSAGGTISPHRGVCQGEMGAVEGRRKYGAQAPRDDFSTRG